MAADMVQEGLIDWREALDRVEPMHLLQVLAPEFAPEDIVGMHASAGILTSRGGMTSHAAVAARGMGKPCVVGAGDLEVDEHAGTVQVGDLVLHERDQLSIDGTAGEVIAGGLSPKPSLVLKSMLDRSRPEDSGRTA